MSRDHFSQAIGLVFITIVQCIMAMLVVCLSSVSAQQLSTRHYDVSDGLANSYVGAIHQDAKGYLWFGTQDGLSRFDGYRFTNYGTRDGLGYAVINAVVEDRQGRLWVGTNGSGVARLINDSREALPSRTAEAASSVRRKFIGYRVGDSPASNRVNALLFDANDKLWCASDAGLYRAAASEDGDLIERCISNATIRAKKGGALTVGCNHAKEVEMQPDYRFLPIARPSTRFGYQGDHWQGCS